MYQPVLGYRLLPADPDLPAVLLVLQDQLVPQHLGLRQCLAALRDQVVQVDRGYQRDPGALRLQGRPRDPPPLAVR